MLPCVLLAIAGCSSDPGTSGNSATAIAPSQVEHALQQLDTIATDIMQRSGIPGMAIAVVHQNAIVYAKGFGVRRMGDPAPVGPETVFQLASLSKPLGATVVATQVGKGVISWNTPVVQHLPWFALHDTATVTVGDLYAHRSGLPEHAGDELEELGHDRRNVLERLHLLPLNPPGSTYAYTNFGLTAAAEAVATASGDTWEALSEQVLYDPLGMTATSSRFTDFMAQADRAYPHILAGTDFVAGFQRQPDAQSPAGGASSNVLDMTKWMNLVLNEGWHDGRQVVRRAGLLPALTPQIESSPAHDDQPARHYGYGFNIGTSEYGHVNYSHSGAFLLGAATSFTLLPAADTGIVVLANAQPVGAVEAITSSYIDLVEHGHITRDWFAFIGPIFAKLSAPMGQFSGLPFPARPAPALPPHAYVGTYTNSYYGDTYIAQEGQGLVLRMGPNQQAHQLRHWDGHVFIFEPRGESFPAGSRSAVTFTPGPGSMAQAMTIELYDEDGLGTLTRR